MQKLVLIEHFTPNEAQLVESRDSAKNLFLAGRIMAADQKNLNGRIYPKSEISNAVNGITESLKSGVSCPGELNHPSDLTINLANVSHLVTEAWMDGPNAMGKCKILNTPSGQIVQNLIEGGMKLGVSSRGTGSVDTKGIVEGFQFVALDIVAQPSGPGCYPDAIRESMEHTKIRTLAEAVVEDPKAQKYLQKEILKFIEAITKG